MIGRVYKIANADESIVYIGSTTLTLKERWWIHKSSYNRWVDGKGKACSIIEHFHAHGIDSFSISLVSEHEVEERKQLNQFEQLVIDKTSCVNMVRAFITESEKKARDNRYRMSHHEELRQYQERYRRQNADELSEQNRQYRQDNRERINENNRVKVECGCGISVSKRNMAAHRRSNKHQQWLATQT